MMTEIEKVKSEIKVLEAKLSFLEELERTKTPCEEAFKRVYNRYPATDVNDTYWDGLSWIDFKFGYNAAQEDYKVGEYQEKPEENEWKNVALEFGKNLPVSLPHSYDKLSPNAWYRWVVFTYDSYIEQRDIECGYTPKSKEVEKLQQKEWTCKVNVASNPQKSKTLYELFENESAYRQLYFEDAYNVAKKWLDDNTEILDEDYDTVTLKLSKGMLK
jgi:hypothetical protein